MHYIALHHLSAQDTHQTGAGSTSSPVYHAARDSHRAEGASGPFLARESRAGSGLLRGRARLWAHPPRLRSTRVYTLYTHSNDCHPSPYSNDNTWSRPSDPVQMFFSPAKLVTVSAPKAVTPMMMFTVTVSLNISTIIITTSSNPCCLSCKLFCMAAKASPSSSFCTLPSSCPAQASNERRKAWCYARGSKCLAKSTGMRRHCPLRVQG